MTSYLENAVYRGGMASGIGILITNLGTPDAPTSTAVRRYLAEFLMDSRVVELPRLIWWPALHGVVLRLRPARSAHAYRRIWGQEGSPLLVIARRQESALQQVLQGRYNDAVKVVLAMRYGKPSIREGLETLRCTHPERLLILPLYPQYAGATTASTWDAVSASLKTWRHIPQLRFITHYHDDKGYIEAITNSIREYWAVHGSGERLLFSFHGMPEATFIAGDPYCDQCHKTAGLVAERLNLPSSRWQVAFQSRFGRAKWLQPYTDQILHKWAVSGIRWVDVICPGFSADCLETLEEIAILNRNNFLAAGGTCLNYIPALNDRPDHINALADIVVRHLQGWLDGDLCQEGAAGIEIPM